MNKSIVPTRVLVIEDEETQCELMGSILKQSCESIEYDYALNGLEGLQKCVQFKPDIIFMDLNMPIMDGWEACSYIRRSKYLEKQPKIVCISGSVSGMQISELKNAGFDDVVPKPWDLQALIDHVKEVNVPQIEIG